MSRRSSRSRLVPGGPARSNRPPDASMSLLHEVMYHPVDPGYAEAAMNESMPLR